MVAWWLIALNSKQAMEANYDFPISSTNKYPPPVPVSQGTLYALASPLPCRRTGAKLALERLPMCMHLGYLGDPNCN